MYCWSPQWFLRPLWQDTTLAPYGVGAAGAGFTGAGFNPDLVTNVAGAGPFAKKK
jgi:hypothetical protein